LGARRAELRLLVKPAIRQKTAGFLYHARGAKPPGVLWKA
jgi:hypothetical protein